MLDLSTVWCSIYLPFGLLKEPPTVKRRAIGHPNWSNIAFTCRLPVLAGTACFDDHDARLLRTSNNGASRLQQVQEFAKEVIGKPVFIVCNSVGGVAGLQAGVDAPDQVSTLEKCQPCADAWLYFFGGGASAWC